MNVKAYGWVALAAAALAYGVPAAAQGTPRKQHAAVRVQGAPPQVDGRLDDAAWAAAPVLSDFVQKEPVEGAPPTDRTEVRFVYDDEALYVGARMYARDPASIQAPVSRRDQGHLAEHLLVSLDTYLDRKTAYTFGVTAAGVRLDHYHPRDHENDRDESFDPVWWAEARIDSAGWTAEMRIPFSQLRFNDLPEQAWGMNLDRWIPSREEDDYWVPVPRGVQAWASRFGDLAGIRGVRPSRRVELIPYVAAEGTRRSTTDPGDPFVAGREGSVRVGGDLRMGLGSSLTLEATVNPDFGQVEADPAEVNLSAFETFFPEKRPFFTEGARYLRSGDPGYFYSRRIGAAPRVPVRADYVDYPRNTAILGAAKLTGRTNRGLSVGALAAVTGESRARYLDEDGLVRTVGVAPRTGWGVFRASQEFGASGSTAGFSFTALRRGVDDGSLAAAHLPRTALTGGADWLLRFRGGDYEVSGHVGGSVLEGDTAAIRRVQTAPAHYLQRPDRAYARLDPTRTWLGGYTAALGIERNNARHWLWEVDLRAISPGLDLNEAGRMFVADFLSADGGVTYRETTPAGWHRGYALSVGVNNGWDWHFIRRHGQVGGEAEVTFANYWRGRLEAGAELRRYDASSTRGGPRTGLGHGVRLEAGLGNRQTAAVRWQASVHGGRGEQGDREWGGAASLGVTPGPRWQVSLQPSYRRSTEPRQYIAALPGGPQATFGSRYVFSFIDRSTLSAPVRLGYLFSPDLSLEVYAEPFAASGRYHRFGELPAPRSFGLEEYGEAGPIRSCGARTDAGCSPGAHQFTAGPNGQVSTVARDFNVRSFRSNTVLRWEWRPGSTLFVVWQQDRSSRTATGEYVGPAALGDVFGAPGDDFLAIKLTYWLPVR